MLNCTVSMINKSIKRKKPTSMGLKRLSFTDSEFGKPALSACLHYTVPAGSFSAHVFNKEDYAEAVCRFCGGKNNKRNNYTRECYSKSVLLS